MSSIPFANRPNRVVYTFESAVRPGRGADVSPDGQWVAYRSRGKMFRLFAGGGTPEGLSTGPHQPTGLRVSRDGSSVYFSVNEGPQDQQDLWRLSLADGVIGRLARLEGRPGSLGYDFAASAEHVYAIWLEQDSDMWVMDTVTPASR